MLRTAPALLALLALSTVGTAEDQKPAQQPQSDAQVREKAAQQPATTPQRTQPQTRQRVQTPQNQPLRQQREAGFRGTGQAGELESTIADCLILGNKEEIALLQFGAEHTKNEEVKKLAERMIQDHEKAIQSLNQFGARAQTIELQGGAAGADRQVATREARRVGAEAPAANNAAAAAAPAQAGNAPTNRPAAAAPGAAVQGSDLAAKLFQIEHQVAENCLAMTQKELAEYEGEKFDHAFVGQQTGMHIGMLARLKAIEGNVSGELQQVVQQAQQTTEEHKQHLEKLMAQLKDPGQGERREAAN